MGIYGNVVSSLKKGNILSKFLLVVFTSAFLILNFPLTAYAGYTSWDQVPAENKEYAKAFFLSLREEGLSVEVATAMTARANSESGFDPFMLEGGNSGWEYRLQAPTVDSPPAFGFLQMQDRSAGGRLGKMIAYVEGFEGGKGTTDKTVSARAQAKYAVEEFKEYDAFAVFSVVDQGGTAVVTSTGTTYPIDLKKYGYTEPIDSWEKFKNLKDSRLATLVWTMSTVRPAGWAYGGSYQNDFAMLDAIAQEFGGLSAGSSSTSSAESGSASASMGIDDSLPEEWDLVGLTKKMNMYESQQDINFVDSSGLSKTESANIASIRESVNSNKFQLINFLRTIVAFVGVWFMVWGILLLVAYAFDKVNTFLEFSLVSILTAGSVTVLALDDESERQKGRSQVLKRVFSAFGVSFILISGTIYVGLSNIYYWLTDFMSNYFSK